MTFDVVFSESDQTFRTEFEELNIVSGDVIKAQDKTVSPAETAQVVQPDTGYNYLSQVTVEAIPASLYADSELLYSYMDKSITSFKSSGVTAIRPYAFYRDAGIEAIMCPNVTSVGNDAFYLCGNLSYVDLPNLSSIPQNCFYSAGKTSTAESKYNVPNVIAVGNHGFYECRKIKKLDFHKLLSIADYGFYNATSLETLIIRTPDICALATTTALSGTPIKTSTITGYIYVPQSLVEQYKAATNWATYADKIRAIEDYPEIAGEVSG